MLFSKRRKTSDLRPPGADSGRQLILDREALYRRLSDSFLGWLKDFALESEDIESREYTRDVENLRAALQAPDDSDLPDISHRDTGFIPKFIVRQQQHIQERDAELHGIVRVLTGAVIQMNSRNSEYHSEMHDQLESMTQLTRIEDIRKLRSRLAIEIEQLRELGERKHVADSGSMQSLSAQVDVLRAQLELAQEESRRDALTGTYNRRAFDAFLDEQLATRCSRKSHFALMMLDIDNFKAINDQFGHLLGDRVLLAVVEICRGLIRSEDVFARLGGDEFAILFPGASARVAKRKGDTICSTLASRLFTEEESAERPGASLSISVSIGVTACKVGDSSADLLKRADAALYEAKRTGRNGVCVG